ncbi:MAG: alpha/beta hydrolase [Polyangiaceae bacterium]
MTAFVLKYRVEPYRFPAALRDVLRAVRLVRSRAAEFQVDPQRIGVFGSSAGGHLALSAGTLFDAPEGKTGAALDGVDARPDFMALLYPVVTMREPFVHRGSRRALLGDAPSEQLIQQASLESRVSARTPPAFLVHSAEDASVPLENTLLVQRALSQAHVPVEAHLYQQGPHGFRLEGGARHHLAVAAALPRMARRAVRGAAGQRALAEGSGVTVSRGAAKLGLGWLLADSTARDSSPLARRHE